ncbi:hypothetical protein J2T15_004986 [Paenibacillus harenae]|uniref:Glycosyl hydrolase family 32 N-terminal domain-containing protein n=2 Tax=Paenibacillus harenae TaxID=306543 RepID=A0ABT9U793_PAEHA|nr:hypothetical protein [Paenibacillus harenae]
MMLDCKDIQIRDPFVLPMPVEGKYYMFGSTDKNIWGAGTGFDAYVSRDLLHWEGPHPVFRPAVDFFSDTNFWAPEVYAYGSRYYMFAMFRRRDNGLLGTAVLAAGGTAFSERRRTWHGIPHVRRPADAHHSCTEPDARREADFPGAYRARWRCTRKGFRPIGVEKPQFMANCGFCAPSE